MLPKPSCLQFFSPTRTNHSHPLSPRGAACLSLINLKVWQIRKAGHTLLSSSEVFRTLHCEFNLPGTALLGCLLSITKHALFSAFDDPILASMPICQVESMARASEHPLGGFVATWLSTASELWIGLLVGTMSTLGTGTSR